MSSVVVVRVAIILMYLEFLYYFLLTVGSS
jgi:hypothetical protein